MAIIPPFKPQGPSSEPPKEKAQKAGAARGRRWSADFTTKSGKPQFLAPGLLKSQPEAHKPQGIKRASITQLMGSKDSKELYDQLINSMVKGIHSTFSSYMKLSQSELSGKGLKNRSNELIRQWENQVIQLFDLLRKKDDDPNNHFIYLLFEDCLNDLSMDDPDKKWEEKFDLLSEQIQRSKIKITGDDEKLILKRLSKKHLEKFFRALEFESPFKISNFLFSKFKKRSGHIAQYFNYFNKNKNMRVDGWVFFSKVMNYLSNQRGRSLYTTGLNILGNKFLELDRQYLNSIVKPLFNPAQWGAPEIIKILNPHFFNLKKVGDKVDFIHKCDNSSYKELFAKSLKESDIPLVLETLKKSRDVKFAASLFYHIYKEQPGFLNKIDWSTSWNTDLKGQLFIEIWGHDPKLPLLPMVRLRDVDWRRKALGSELSKRNTLQDKFDLVASWQWYDSSLLREMIRSWKVEDIKTLSELVIEHAQKHPENYLQIIKVIYEVRPEFKMELNNQISSNVKWDNTFRDKLIVQFFDEIDLKRFDKFYIFFPIIKTPVEALLRRFENRSKLPVIGGLNQNIGPELECLGLAGPLNNLTLSDSEKKMLTLLATRFQDAGALFTLNFHAQLPGRREKLVLMLEKAISELGEIPNDLMIFSFGTAEHAIVISLFRAPHSKEFTMLITNTGLGVDMHTKIAEPELLYTVTEEITGIPPESFIGPEGNKNLMELLKMRSDKEGLPENTEISPESQKERFYKWVKKIKKDFPDTSNQSEFIKLYPKRHAQYGGSCVFQSTRQADKYLMTRLLWENRSTGGISAETSSEEQFWDCYSRAQLFLHNVDSQIVRWFPQQDEFYLEAQKKILKKGSDIFAEAAKGDNYKKALDALEQASDKTGVLLPPLLESQTSMSKELKLKTICKNLVKRWVALGSYPESIELSLKDIKNPVITIAIARYKYKFDALNYVQSEFFSRLFSYNLTQKVQFDPSQIEFISNTLNQWPENNSYRLGVFLMDLIKANAGTYFGANMAELSQKLKGNRFYFLFKPMADYFLKSSPIDKNEFLDIFLSLINFQQKQELHEEFEYPEEFQKKFESVLKEIADKEPFAYPIEKVRLLFYLEVSLKKRDVVLKDFEIKALKAILPSLSQPEKEYLLAPFISEATKQAASDGKSWIVLTPEEKDTYLNSQILKAA